MSKKQDPVYDDDSLYIKAKDAVEARKIHPNGFDDWNGIDNDTWCNAEKVEVKYLGELAYENYNKYSSGVVCASFNAG